MADLTQQQLEDFEYVESLATEGEPFCLDLSDERQYRYLIAAHEHAGHTPENRPGLFKGLAAAREEHAETPPVGISATAEGWESGGAVTDVGLAFGTRAAAANGFSGFVHGAEVVHSWLTVRPTGGTQVLAEGAASDYLNGSYVPIKATPVAGQAATPTMTATLVYSYKLENETWRAETVVRKVTFVGENDPVVEQPKKEGTDAKYRFIQIAIGRGEGKVEDCDYWLAFNPSEANYYVPFVGHVEFASPPPAKAGLELNKNIFITGRLARLTEQKKPEGGSKELPQDQIERLLKSIQVSGNTMSWNMPAPPKVHSPSEHGDTLNWGIWEAGKTGELIFLYLQILVKLSENPDKFGIANVESSFEADDNPTDGSTIILPLKFVYSCFAMGTQILMADGSRKPFELVERGELVRAGDGSEREVASSRVGRYVGKMLKLTAGEAEILLSHNHVVAKGDGSHCFAAELEAGEMVNSPAGPVELTAVEEVGFDGHLGNLSLSEPDEQAEAARNSMFAGGGGGIEVCDYEVQCRWEYRRTRGREAVLQNLDPDYHRDYLNYLEEQEAVS